MYALERAVFSKQISAKKITGHYLHYLQGAEPLMKCQQFLS